MKHFVFILGLLTALMVNTAQQQLTIKNINLPTVGVDTRYVDMTTGKLLEGSKIQVDHISPASAKIFTLIGTRQDIKNLFTLSLESWVPSFVHLRGLIPGDSIVVCHDEESGIVTILNEQTQKKILCAHKKAPVIIGSVPESFLTTKPLKLTFRNNNLLSTIVKHKALRNRFDQGMFRHSPTWLNEGSENANLVAYSKKFTLQKGEQEVLLTYSSSDPNITKTVTELIFSESPQRIRMFIRPDVVSSGDILEMGFIEKDNRIGVWNTTRRTLLALVYVNSRDSLTTTFHAKS